MLFKAGVDFEVQATGRRLTSDELASIASPFGVLIAGTESITANVMDCAKDLRLIARVGVGLDGVDLTAARARGIAVSYTPHAPAPAVAEFTVGLMIDLMRHVTAADRSVRNGTWKRIMGRRMDGATIGVIGVGRIGSRVVKILRGAFPSIRVLANDIQPGIETGRRYGIEWVGKEELLASSDLVTLHVPLTTGTRHMISMKELQLMRPSAVLVNTARGAVVCEKDLAAGLRSGILAGAAIDVFETEPYSGDLVSIPNCLLTCHMASMDTDCRARMEIEATEDAIRFLQGEKIHQIVPETEYELQGNLR
jgi:D-3-phosphoglycerate dehydrogenase